VVRPEGQPSKRFLIDELWLRRFVGGTVIATLLRLVKASSRVVFDPPNHLQASAEFEPAIYVTWHANLLAHPIMLRDGRNLVNLTSPHPDGRLAAALSEAFGVTSIAAAGASPRQGRETGGSAGFRALLRAIRAGKSVLLTGEIPPVPGRSLAPGIVALARHSGRPIIAMGAASTHMKIVERLWDRLQVDFPFGTFFVVAAPPIWVKEGDSDELAGAAVKTALDRCYDEAISRAKSATKRMSLTTAWNPLRGRR
jgi:lysophospholipid acyltransferase (LPLAT)-like uncharacterized protein